MPLPEDLHLRDRPFFRIKVPGPEVHHTEEVDRTARGLQYSGPVITLRVQHALQIQYNTEEVGMRT